MGYLLNVGVHMLLLLTDGFKENCIEALRFDPMSIGDVEC
jgi:hypothetical protein